MAQWQKAHTAFAEDPNWLPGTHVGQVITACNSSSR